MKTKFIGLDGFGEIETITSKERFNRNRKSVRKTADNVRETAKNRREAKQTKPTRLERHYAERRKNGSGSLGASVAASTVRTAKKSSLRHASSKRVFSPHFLRNKAALGLTTSLVAVMLAIFVPTSSFAAADNAVSEPVIQSETADITVNDTELSKTVNADIAQSMSDDEILTDGYGLYIDGELAGVSLDKKKLQKALQNVLDEYKAKYDDKTTDKFANNVEIVGGAYKSVYIADSEDIIKENYDKFSFSLSTDIVLKQTIPFTVKYKYDNTKYTSYSKTIQRGVSSKQRITYRVTYVDGVQTDAVATKVKTVKKGRDKIIVKGTKKAAASTTSSYSAPVQTSYSSSASGSFMWPLPYTHNLTSGYGSRWGRFHSGIDIAAGGVYGKTIVASDSGTVEWAGYDSSGYGNYVIINHGNGYKTLYGHCSALYVSRGQSVSKGAAIAAVGSTGDSTGPHLHFEVRTSSGSRLNPLGFVS